MDFCVIPSMDCTLRCEYCCVLDSLGKEDGSNLEDIKKFLDWQLALYPKEDEHTLEFFGGEPLLRYDIVQGTIDYLNEVYPKIKFSYRIYTNGIWKKELEARDEFSINFFSQFDDIIVSIDGEYEDNLYRTKNKKLYERSIDNFKWLLDNGMVAGIAFVLLPTTRDYKRIFEYFRDMGCQYFHFEIASLWNDNKDNNISLKYLYDTYKFIYENILVHNKNCLLKDDLYSGYIYSVPREFLASKYYFISPKYNSCMDSVRALSPRGNVYFCRDLAANESNLYDKYQQGLANRKLIASSNSFIKPFNITDLQLNSGTNSFSESARYYDSIIPCPVKSFEFEHFAHVDYPWIRDDTFQRDIVVPIHKIMEMNFSFYHNMTNDKYEDFKKDYILFVDTYGQILDYYEEQVFNEAS